MKILNIPNGPKNVSAIVQGCMRMPALSKEDAAKVIRTAYHDSGLVAKIAEREGASKTAVAIAWILRHPAKMQAVIGTMNPEHIKDACKATDVNLSHHDWYELYLAAGKYLP